MMSSELSQVILLTAVIPIAFNGLWTVMFTCAGVDGHYRFAKGYDELTLQPEDYLSFVKVFGYNLTHRW